MNEDNFVKEVEKNTKLNTNKKLKLNIIKYFLKKIKQKTLHLISLFEKKVNTEATQDLLDTIKFIVIHGLMLTTTLLTYLHVRYNYKANWWVVVYVLGTGSAYYFTLDIIKYLTDQIVRIRGK